MSKGPLHQEFDHLTAPRASIDIVAKRNDARRLTAGVIENPQRRSLKQIDPPVKVGNGVSQAHEQLYENRATPRRGPTFLKTPPKRFWKRSLT